MIRPAALAARGMPTHARNATRTALRALVALACLPAASAWASSVTPAGNDDGSADLLRRVVQTLVAVGVLVIMARPSGEARTGPTPAATGAPRSEPRSMSSASASGVR